MKFGQSFLVIIAAVCSIGRGDIPVHCLRSEVTGTWHFKLGKPSEHRSSCGHARPDVDNQQPVRAVVDSLGELDLLPVVLLSPNIAKANGETGTWTMVYDEGFEVRLGKRTFFAFSNFTFDEKANPVSPHNVSHCFDTMVGWYSNQERTEFGCYYGSKSSSSATMLGRSIAVHTQRKEAAKNKVSLDHATQAAKVEKLNQKLALVQAGWRARVMPQWYGKSMDDLNRYAGIQRTTPSRDLQHDMLAQRVAEPKRRSFLQKLEATHALPDTFDWSNVNGIDYTEPVMDQGDCGSCYDASTMRMLTARHKIATNNTGAVPWSINFPLFCSEYNQGCKGGFGFLTTKWSEEVGLIPATCMRYNTSGSCSLQCDLEKELKGQKRYRASNHRYISSWYGNFKSGEEAIRQEIFHNGPVVLSFEPNEDFMFYSGGIFNATTAIAELARKTKGAQALVNHVDFDTEWTRVDHAVVAVGWGEEDGQKYWKIQNSWGPDWGEDGYFRIQRGTDESGIETSPEAADVVEDEQNGRQVSALLTEVASKRAQ